MSAHTRMCPNCGAPGTGLAEFCESCGTRVIAVRQSQPVASPPPAPPVGVPTSSRSTGPWVLVAILGTLVVVGGGIAIWLGVSGNGKAPAVAPTVTRTVVEAGVDSSVDQPIQTPAPVLSGSPSTGTSAEGNLSGVSCQNSYGCPAISAVGAEDVGASVRTYLDYCDRTYGRVNRFAYTFQLIGKRPLARTVQISQTRACNRVSATFSGALPPGTYRVRVSIHNRTNEVYGGATGPGFDVR